MLKLDQITKKFHIGTPDETTLFNQFCFEVQKGEFVSIVGSNGSGKTTLLNIVCGSLPVEGGKILPVCRNTNVQIKSAACFRIRKKVPATN
jgi:putative ABC transport system ATP-binding protein